MIGAGVIAPTFALAAQTSQTGHLYAVACRDKAKAEHFAREYGVSVAYGSYEELLRGAKVDAVYICLPHTMHAKWTIAAVEAGKHVLCEKPFAVNHAEAMVMIATANRHNRIVMEAFMHRCHPQTSKLGELLRGTAIGEIRVMQGSFSYHTQFDANNRVYQNHMAGGSILELGGYPVSLARLVAGVAPGGEIADPIEIKAAGHVRAERVDEWATAILRFDRDIVAQVSACLGVTQDNAFRIFGSEGQLTLPNPYVPNRQNAGCGTIVIQRGWETPQVIEVPAQQTSFSYEVDYFARAIANGSRLPEYPAPSSADTLGNMRALDAWRTELGCL